MKPYLFIIAILMSLSAFPQEKRLALVIGNSAYEYGGVLRNPVNDAFAMKQALSDVGFEVREYYNLDQGEMKKAIDDFGEELWDYEVGLFYYAGHGIQVNGSNYLIPVDANLVSERFVEYDCVAADRALANMDAAESLVNIVILDACRNNPFERSWSRSAGSQGLAFMNAPNGTLIAYATSPGNIASDGEALNGIYTEALLENIREPDITVIQVFQNVRSLVSRRTRERQIPWESTSLTRDFYFNRQNIPETISYADSSFTPPLFTEEDRTAFESSEESTVTLVERNTSGILMDQRDGNEYKWVRIGEQIWMAENLIYEFADSWLADTAYGRIYSWDAALEVCPDGWHLPTDEEWIVLEMYLGMDSTEATKNGIRGTDEAGKLKERGTSHWSKTTQATTNETGFSALPAGKINFVWGTVSRRNTRAYFWSSTYNNIWGGSHYRLLEAGDDRVFRDIAGVNTGMSVRCVKNK